MSFPERVYGLSSQRKGTKGDRWALVQFFGYEMYHYPALLRFVSYELPDNPLPGTSRAVGSSRVKVNEIVPIAHIVTNNKHVTGQHIDVRRVGSQPGHYLLVICSPPLIHYARVFFSLFSHFRLKVTGREGDEIEAMVFNHFEIEVTSFSFPLFTTAEYKRDLCIDVATSTIFQNGFEKIA
jgi:hypothetical protein